MKSYTDLEQSRKLAEILPLESADMRYAPFGDTHPWVWNEKVKLLEKDSVPCWSLAALVGVLPYGYSSILTKSFDGKDYYCKIDGKPFETNADNPVDACVEMILKLHELKKL